MFHLNSDEICYILRMPWLVAGGVLLFYAENLRLLLFWQMLHLLEKLAIATRSSPAITALSATPRNSGVGGGGGSAPRNAQKFWFGENLEKTSGNLGKNGAQLGLIWKNRHPTFAESHEDFFWKPSHSLRSASEHVVRVNLGKNPSHPPKNTCFYTYAVGCFSFVFLVSLLSFRDLKTPIKMLYIRIICPDYYGRHCFRVVFESREQWQCGMYESASCLDTPDCTMVILTTVAVVGVFIFEWLIEWNGLHGSTGDRSDWSRGARACVFLTQLCPTCLGFRCSIACILRACPYFDNLKFDIFDASGPDLNATLSHLCPLTPWCITFS